MKNFPLIFRFDLIFLMLDPQDEVFDRRLGRHLVSLYYKSQDEDAEENIDMSILRDYIAYAKQTFNPKLTDEAGTLLTQSYVNMRKIGSGRGQITAYPRWFFCSFSILHSGLFPDHVKVFFCVFTWHEIFSISLSSETFLSVFWARNE